MSVPFNTWPARQRIKAMLLAAIAFGFLFPVVTGWYLIRNQDPVEYHRAAMLKARKGARWVASLTSSPKDFLWWWLKGSPHQSRYIETEREHYTALKDLGYFTEREFAVTNGPLRYDRIDVIIAAGTNFPERLWYVVPSTSAVAVMVIAPPADMEDWRKFLAAYDASKKK